MAVRPPRSNEDQWCTRLNSEAHSMDIVLMAADQPMTIEEILDEARRLGHTTYKDPKSAYNHLMRLAGLRREQRGTFIERIEGKPFKWMRLASSKQNNGSIEVLADDDAREAEAEADADNYELSDDDSRKLIQRQIRDRRGQKEFRELLCNRFDNQCVVTKCKIVAVLEAAHIRPYRRIEDNDGKNGLLLRADIHTLFDLNLIGVEPETWIVRIHPKIRETYAEFDGRQLVMRSGITPSSAAVSYRFNQFQERLKIWI